MSKFEIIIASLPHKERPVAEIFYDNMYWVQISYETEDEDPIVEFYAHPYKKCWEFPIDEALEVLEKAKTALLN